jgi:hypothetical protein
VLAVTDHSTPPVSLDEPYPRSSGAPPDHPTERRIGRG